MQLLDVRVAINGLSKEGGDAACRCLPGIDALAHLVVVLQTAAHQHPGHIASMPCGQESYGTEQAAQLARAVEKNSSVVFAGVISRDGPVAISGTYLSVSIVQVPDTLRCSRCTAQGEALVEPSNVQTNYAPPVCPCQSSKRFAGVPGSAGNPLPSSCPSAAYQSPSGTAQPRWCQPSAQLSHPEFSGNQYPQPYNRHGAPAYHPDCQRHRRSHCRFALHERCSQHDTLNLMLPCKAMQQRQGFVETPLLDAGKHLLHCLMLSWQVQNL